MTKTIYIVSRASGEYDSFVEVPIRAFVSEDRARAFAEECQKEADTVFEHNEKVLCDIEKRRPQFPLTNDWNSVLFKEYEEESNILHEEYKARIIKSKADPSYNGCDKADYSHFPIELEK